MRSRERTFEALVEMWAINGGWPIHIGELVAATGRARSSVHADLHGLQRAGLIEQGPPPFGGWRPVQGPR